MNRTISALTVCALTGGMATMAAASAIPYGASGDLYTQNFDMLPYTPENTTFLYQDDVTVPNWLAVYNATIDSSRRLRAGSGANNVGSFWSYGATNSTERAMGSLGSSTVGTLRFGTRFVNNTGHALTEFTLAFTGEQWRDGGTTTTGSVAQRLKVAYSLVATSIDQDRTDPTSYTTIPELEFVTPNVGRTTGTALDGNLPENRKDLSFTIAGINWEPGKELWIRWLDADDSGNDHGMAIDDLKFSAVPEPATLVLVVLGLAGVTRRRG
jgi:hypothetical protein